MRKTAVLGAIAAIIVMAFLPARASAAYEYTGPTFTAGSNIEAERGATVTVPITVSNNPGFAAAALVVSYDPDALQITGVTAPVPSMPLNDYFALTTSPGTQWISLINPSGSDWGGSGTVANVTFSVRPNAPTGYSYIGLGFTSAPDGTPGNSAGNLLLNSATVSGSVIIAAEYAPSYAAPAAAAYEPTYASGGQAYPQYDAGSDFIGAPASLPNASDGDPSVTEPSEPTRLTAPDANQDYGAVPQTGVADMLALSIMLGMGLAASAALWARIIRKKRAED